jgi:SP family sugar porter-like MFS transporter
MLGMAAIPSAVLFFILAMLPESPRWLIMNRHEDKAMDTLRKIGGDIYALNIAQSVKTTSTQTVKPSFRDLFQRRYLKVLIIGAVLTIIQQWCGTNLIFSYSPLIFQSAGFDTSHAVFQTVIIGFCNFIATIISIKLVKTMGRKTILIMGLACIIVTLIIIGLYFQFHIAASWILILSALLSVSAFAMTLGPVMWIVIAEISPSRIRSQAMSLFIFCLWTAGMLGTFSFPLLRSALGTPVIFYIYAAICVSGVIFISEFIPETKDKTLEEIEKLFK